MAKRDNFFTIIWWFRAVFMIYNERKKNWENNGKRVIQVVVYKHDIKILIDELRATSPPESEFNGEKGQIKLPTQLNLSTINCNTIRK